MNNGSDNNQKQTQYGKFTREKDYFQIYSSKIIQNVVSISVYGLIEELHELII